MTCVTNDMYIKQDTEAYDSEAMNADQTSSSGVQKNVSAFVLIFCYLRLRLFPLSHTLVNLRRSRLIHWLDRIFASILV